MKIAYNREAVDVMVNMASCQVMRYGGNNSISSNRSLDDNIDVSIDTFSMISCILIYFAYLIHYL